MSSIKRLADPPESPQTFEQLMNNITGVVDTNVSRVKLLVNKPNQILYRVKRLQSSIERAANPLTWPAAHALDELEASMHDLERLPEKARAIAVGRRTLRYIAQSRMTLQQIAQATSNSVDDLIQLNPRLLSRPAIPPGSLVRYYSDAGILSQLT
jgi:G3E family GTPase